MALSPHPQHEPLWGSPLTAPLPNPQQHLPGIIGLSEAVGAHPVLRELGVTEACLGDIKMIANEMTLSKGVLEALIPNQNLRPLLALAVLKELRAKPVPFGEYSREVYLAHSPILQILNTPYSPIYMERAISVISRMAHDSDPEFKFEMVQNLAKDAQGLNSTLRNLALALRLNQTLFRGTDCRAQIALAQYTWRELGAKVSRYDLPGLPHRTLDAVNLKFIIAVVRNGIPLSYLDYGQNEGNEEYGDFPTGEGAGSIVGRPFPHRLITVEKVQQVIDGLREVTNAQQREGEFEAIRRINLHRLMNHALTDFANTAEGSSFPSVITSVTDLSEIQLQAVLRWSSLVESMMKGSVNLIGNEQVAFEPRVVFTPFSGLRARVEVNQPSTRTVTAAADAFRALGMHVEVPGVTSSAKGESQVSEAVTLGAHAVHLVARRDPSVENASGVLRELGDTTPVFISLGGNEHHPTQTLGEIKLFFDTYGVDSYSLHDLRETTSANPPTITFIGRTDQKRADKALIKFIMANLPQWKVRVVVPHEVDLPKFEGITSPNYSAIVELDLTNQGTVISVTEGSTFLYVSNAEATSHISDKGSGQGKQAAPHFISVDILSRNNCLLLHPLPASGELDNAVFSHPNSRLTQQMQNKIFVITSLAAHQLMGKRKRAEQRG